MFTKELVCKHSYNLFNAHLYWIKVHIAAESQCEEGASVDLIMVHDTCPFKTGIIFILSAIMILRQILF